MNVCSEAGCNKPRKARGLCGACYKRHRLASTLPSDYVQPYGKGRPIPRMPCDYPGCANLGEIPSAGLCRSHYQQKWRGELLRPLLNQMTLTERLLAKREIDPTTGCWLWTGTLDTPGYGAFGFAGKAMKAHRAAAELWIGPLNGDIVHHKCHVRRCFNPEHLQIATRSENTLEMHERLALRRKIRTLEARVATLEAA